MGRHRRHSRQFSRQVQSPEPGILVTVRPRVVPDAGKP